MNNYAPDTSNISNTLITQEIIWECECGTRLVQDAKRRRLVPKVFDFPTKSNPEAYKRTVVLIINQRNCKHENKNWNPAYCKRCGRRLTNHKSVERNIGPVCYCKDQKAKAEMAIEKEIREVPLIR